VTVAAISGALDKRQIAWLDAADIDAIPDDAGLGLIAEVAAAAVRSPGPTLISDASILVFECRTSAARMQCAVSS
jgi:hypothetical protein